MKVESIPQCRFCNNRPPRGRVPNMSDYERYPESSAHSVASSHSTWIPDQELTLHATEWWKNASLRDRASYSRAEEAASAAMVCELELYLVETISHEIRRRIRTTLEPVELDRLLTEASDELRHVRMFMVLVDSTTYLGKIARIFMKVASYSFIRRRVAFAGTFFIENYLCAIHGRSAHDPQLTTNAARIHKVHFRDEQPHLRLAERAIAEQWASMNRLDKALVRIIVPLIGHVLAYVPLVVPASFPGGSWRAWRELYKSPQRRAVVKQRSADGYDGLSRLGVVGGYSRFLWAKLGLK